MSYNYRYGMPEVHTPITDLMNDGVINKSDLVGSPNETNAPESNGPSFKDMMQMGAKGVVDYEKKKGEAYVAKAIGSGAKAGIAKLASLL